MVFTLHFLPAGSDVVPVWVQYYWEAFVEDAMMYCQPDPPQLLGALWTASSQLPLEIAPPLKRAASSKGSPSFKGHLSWGANGARGERQSSCHISARDNFWPQSYLWGRLWLHWSWIVTKPLWAHLTLPSSWSPIQGTILTGLLITFLLIDLSLIAKQHDLHQHACCSWLQCTVSWICYRPVLTHDLWEVT